LVPPSCRQVPVHNISLLDCIATDRMPNPPIAAIARHSGRPISPPVFPFWYPTHISRSARHHAFTCRSTSRSCMARHSSATIARTHPSIDMTTHENTTGVAGW
jgi:hypothetical protein